MGWDFLVLSFLAGNVILSLSLFPSVPASEWLLECVFFGGSSPYDSNMALDYLGQAYNNDL